MFAYGTDAGEEDMIMGFTPLALSQLQFYNELDIPAENPNAVSELAAEAGLTATPVTRIAPNAFKDI
jgi:hypothetical protein